MIWPDPDTVFGRRIGDQRITSVQKVQRNMRNLRYGWVALSKVWVQVKLYRITIGDTRVSDRQLCQVESMGLTAEAKSKPRQFWHRMC